VRFLTRFPEIALDRCRGAVADAGGCD